MSYRVMYQETLNNKTIYVEDYNKFSQAMRQYMAQKRLPWVNWATINRVKNEKKGSK